MNKFDGAIGIDLGTSYSRVAVWENDKVKIIANDEGARSTLSCVAFIESGCIVGEAAKNETITANPENKIYDVKRFIGRKFTDECVQKDMMYWPFKVIDRGDNTPVVEMKVGGKTKTFTAEEISAEILEYMKEAAEKYLHKKVKKAVMSVPANFNNAQREATKKAAELAGLKVLRIINEPTAAAIAYGCDKIHDNKKHNVLIFDFGGWTFDVTVLTVENGKYEVKATGGDTHLGREDFNKRLVTFVSDDIKRRNRGVNVLSRVEMTRLRTACEEVKRKLSFEEYTELSIEKFLKGESFDMIISREKFEEMCDDLFQSTIPVIIKVLQDAKMDKHDIHDVVLVGGSTRIPKVQSILAEFFDGKDLKQSINPDEAVAYGAAVQAFILAGGKSKETDKLRLSDVTPLTLGVEVGVNEMRKLINRRTRYPTKICELFTTAKDNQKRVTIKIYEGESNKTSECHLLGTFDLTGIPPAPSNVPKIEVTFNVDADGILNVSAQEESSGKRNDIQITCF